jgi:uncharacterized damage-inducible protein DinB
MGRSNHTLLEEVIESWQFARHGVLAEATTLPDEAYGFKPHPQARSVSGLLRHIVESGLVMVGELTNTEGDFTRKSHEDFVREFAEGLPGELSPDDLRRLLDTTLAEGVSRIRAAGEVRMLQVIRRFDGEMWTRSGWMNHGIAHEEYHRGQLAMYARIQGHVPALTRMIHGDDAE